MRLVMFRHRAFQFVIALLVDVNVLTVVDGLKAMVNAIPLQRQSSGDEAAAREFLEARSKSQAGRVQPQGICSKKHSGDCRSLLLGAPKWVSLEWVCDSLWVPLRKPKGNQPVWSGEARELAGGSAKPIGANRIELALETTTFLCRSKGKPERNQVYRFRNLILRQIS